MTSIDSSKISRLMRSCSADISLSPLATTVPSAHASRGTVPRPTPNSMRPPVRMSARAKSSARRSGCHCGTTLNICPKRRSLVSMRQVRAEQDEVRQHLVALVLEVVLGEPHRVEAELVGRLGPVDHVLVARDDGVVAVAARRGGDRRIAGVGHGHGAEEVRVDAHGRIVLALDGRSASDARRPCRPSVRGIGGAGRGSPSVVDRRSRGRGRSCCRTAAAPRPCGRERRARSSTRRARGPRPRPSGPAPLVQVSKPGDRALQHPAAGVDRRRRATGRGGAAGRRAAAGSAAGRRRPSCRTRRASAPSRGGQRRGQRVRRAAAGPELGRVARARG